MCRYAENTYATHYVCLPCRHTTKMRIVAPTTLTPEIKLSNKPRCPQCRVEMDDFGQDFKAPRKEATLQWRKLAILKDLDLLFHSCGCTGPGTRPSTLASAKQLARDTKRKTLLASGPTPKRTH